MSTSIIKFEDKPEELYYCKSDSYPCGIGFDLLKVLEGDEDFEKFFTSERFEKVVEIPKDIQYEYIIQKDGKVHCQENWYARDVSYHGGGFRFGGVYDLVKLRESVKLQEQYSYRRPEAWK